MWGSMSCMGRPLYSICVWVTTISRSPISRSWLSSTSPVSVFPSFSSPVPPSQSLFYRHTLLSSQYMPIPLQHLSHLRWRSNYCSPYTVRLGEYNAIVSVDFGDQYNTVLSSYSNCDAVYRKIMKEGQHDCQCDFSSNWKHWSLYLWRQDLQSLMQRHVHYAGSVLSLSFCWVPERRWSPNRTDTVQIYPLPSLLAAVTTQTHISYGQTRHC